MVYNRRKFIEYGLYTAGSILFADAFWAEKFFIEINEFNIKSATPEKHSIKILQLSDLHLKSVNYQLKKLTEKINQNSPDLIVITGDAIDDRNNLHLLDGFLELIDYSIQKIAILGNWEYWGKVDITSLKELYEKHNCYMLVNKHKMYTINKKTITISGLDDFVGGKSDYEETVNNINDSDFHLVLNHCPGYNDEIIKFSNYNDIKVDLILSGHTHGGQINYFGMVPFLPEGSGKYIKGWYNKKNIPIYVSKGIGTSIYPVRLGSRAEVAFFYL